MGIPVTADDLFKPRPSKAVTKADITVHAALAITRAEAEHREAKRIGFAKPALNRKPCWLPSGRPPPS